MGLKLQVTRLLPNFLSLARLVLGLSFPFFPSSWWLGLMLAAGLSDLIDGEISRRFDASSKLGQILDPIADKVFVLSVLFTLLANNVFELWEIALVGARDIAVLCGAIYIGLGKGWSRVAELRPSWLGKATTAAQFIFMTTAVFYHKVHPTILIATALLSLLAAGFYCVKYARL